MTGWDVLREAGELARAGEAFAVATVVWRQGPSSGQLGSRAIISAGGEVRGWIGGACAQPTVIREARQAIADGQPRLLLLGTGDQFGGVIPAGMTVVPISCQSEGALEVYVEPVLPAPHLMIVGSTPMTRALADLAKVIGWRAEIRDGTEFAAADVDRRSMVVVATQGHGDEDALEQAVAARPAYVGLVGSHRRGAAVLGYLAERGVPADQLERVRVPAGLDLGPTSHVEIAVAILAELVRLRAAGMIPAGLPADGARTGFGAGPAAETAETTDPVCGMTVSADGSGRPLDYQGVTYYFCCAGCRGAFESDPASYARKETRC
jgi:xanthine dehydrogenase accessory factor